MKKDLEIKKIIELLPILSALGICFACINLYSYYSQFNLNIFEYLDLSELVLIALPQFVYSMLLLLLAFYLVTLHPFQDFFSTEDPFDVGDKSNFKVFAVPVIFVFL